MSDYSDNSEATTIEMTIKREILSGTEESNMILASITDRINRIYLPSFFDKSFIASLIESDITSNIKFFMIGNENHAESMVQLDELNDLYIPFTVFLDMVLPTYLSIQVRMAFSDLTSIKDVLNEMASSIQDEIERVTLAVSEEEFKEAKFNKKDLSNEELTANLLSYTKETKNDSPVLDECPLCGKEQINHYYECSSCHYKYCASCCEEIASRQALCPCCREEMMLIDHTSSL